MKDCIVLVYNKLTDSLNMGRKKALRIKQAPKFPNVFDKNSAIKNKGKWNELALGNKNEIVLELGCGRCEYTLELAEMFPQKNFIGIDRKADRLWVGSTNAIKEKLTNAFFIHTDVESIDQMFSKKEISEIWITFPDPYLKKPKRRMTNPLLLEKYKKIVTPGSFLHLKTDEERLYNYTISSLKNNGCKIVFSTKDLYNSELKNDQIVSMSTTYEKKHISQGDTIFYIKFQINEQ